MVIVVVPDVPVSKTPSCPMFNVPFTATLLLISKVRVKAVMALLNCRVPFTVRLAMVAFASIVTVWPVVIVTTSPAAGTTPPVQVAVLLQFPVWAEAMLAAYDFVKDPKVRRMLKATVKAVAHNEADFGNTINPLVKNFIVSLNSKFFFIIIGLEWLIFNFIVL
jgi:hypothetical protein